jgi:RNA polymerase subunit RPABC4/transcription elongation factor Spt4
MSFKKCKNCKKTYSNLKGGTCFNCLNGVFLVNTTESSKPIVVIHSNKGQLNDRHDINGLLYSMYHGQKSSSKQRGHKPPSYTLSELKSWAFNHTNYKQLFKAYKKSGYLPQQDI